MYEPEEDSFLLRDCVLDFLSGKSLNSCLDMGCGSGIQGFAMADFSDRVVFVDINSDSVNYVKSLIKDDGKFSVFVSDLFSNIPSGSLFDLVVFNPPYLPRESGEVDDLDLTSGVSGLDTTLRFLKDCKHFLALNGRVFFVASSLSNLSLLDSFLEKEGYFFRVVKKKHLFFEDIIIYEAWLS